MNDGVAAYTNCGYSRGQQGGCPRPRENRLKMDSQKLPDFSRPPVVETVLGFHFEPLPKFRNAHLGAFWKALPPEWSSLADAPPLAAQTERFNGRSSGRGPDIVVSSQPPDLRMQVRNRAEDRML